MTDYDNVSIILPPVEPEEPYCVCEVMCVECKRRWIDVSPVSLLLKDMECPNGHIGFVIKTGQWLEEGGEQ